MSFSHLHVYCDALRPLEEYKQLERKLNEFAGAFPSGTFGLGADVAAGRAAWLRVGEAYGVPVTGAPAPERYASAGQDLVEQLLVGLGFRITGKHVGAETWSLVVTSQDPNGVKFVVTAHREHALDALAASGNAGDGLDPFGAASLQSFAQAHHLRQGVGLLGFSVGRGDVEAIYARYSALHPKLLVPGTPRQCGSSKILEVYAYYQGAKCTSDADTGTRLRFVEADESLWCLPGVERVEATFDPASQTAYCDHWVSNVRSREGFLDTLNDTLGFIPKVDFNAGVVAAGEAQIESTVTGNTSTFSTRDGKSALKDQSQIYLPINNALSEAGHVHLFLEQMGQGVQHVASRVADLPALIQRANDYRRMTGAGLSFLKIPPSYYGYLTAKRLEQDAAMSAADALACFTALRGAGIIDERDTVDIDLTREQVVAALPAGTPSNVVEHVLRGRYNNLYSLLRDHCTDELYVRIVRNNILVDIQGEDLLLQIFTATVLQREAGQEAPFLEFIQRVCSAKVDETTGQPLPIRPGCGGFGIRNFLTLFLSIEVSKAVDARAAALLTGDAAASLRAGKTVDAFVAQLDESNPILTAISDAMTAEGLALERGDAEAAAPWAAAKAKAQGDLMAVSSKYKAILKGLREEGAQAHLAPPRPWRIRGGPRASSIDNPIRKIMDTIAGKENPNKRVISLAQGDPTVYPHLNPSDIMVSAVVGALTSRAANGYQPSQGNLPCRKAVAEKFSVAGRPSLTPDDIFMTLGCSEALSHCVAALAAPGTNMLLPRPGFPLCQILCDYHGVEPRYYDLLPERAWEIDVDMLRAMADENTCAIVINNPSNPCGSVFSREHLTDVMAVAEDLRIPIIADEVYTGMSFGKPFVSCAEVNPRVPVLSTCALSKRWLAPGWRLGWVTVYDADGALKAAEVPETLLKLCQISLGPAAPLQAAVPAIMETSPMEVAWSQGVLKALGESAKYCVQRCKDVPGLEVASNPEGAMYLMVKVLPGKLRDVNDAVEFAGALLQEESVVVLPGDCFQYPGFFRVVFCAPVSSLEVAWDRIEAFCQKRYIE